MSATAKRLFSLPVEQAAFIDEKVQSGAFANASEVVRAGLRVLQQRNARIERWLHDEVIPTYDRWNADPSRGMSPDELAEHMRQRHKARLKART